ncbi:hypothetical protein [Jhaorihella thermophila]|uniref:Uncharacterized protein n=1 Tax=Jhaorihella thermophila TaxID=488547 RepID=A0A1H5Y350_9RHOB|nr:hypothetical protein [Jhaorihella thermophila]SEG18262.1 hypothetical protein SAMN05421751_11432 [Jhaorihella thermophila]
MARLVPILMCVLALWPATDGRAGTAGHAVCILNATSRPLLLVAEAPDGTRAAAEVAPGKALCSRAKRPATGNGMVGAFTDIDEIEGCSRLTRPGRTQVLVEYHDFDRCIWSED